MLPWSTRERNTGFQAKCPAGSIVLDTGTPLKCSRSLTFSFSNRARHPFPAKSNPNPAGAFPFAPE